MELDGNAGEDVEGVERERGDSGVADGVDADARVVGGEGPVVALGTLDDEKGDVAVGEEPLDGGGLAAAGGSADEDVAPEVGGAEPERDGGHGAAVVSDGPEGGAGLGAGVGEAEPGCAADLVTGERAGGRRGDAGELLAGDPGGARGRERPRRAGPAVERGGERGVGVESGANGEWEREVRGFGERGANERLRERGGRREWGH